MAAISKTGYNSRVDQVVRVGENGEADKTDGYQDRAFRKQQGETFLFAAEDKATEAQAVAGLDDEKYMTAFTVAAAITALSYNPANKSILEGLTSIDGKLAYNGVLVDTIAAAGVGVFTPVQDLTALKALDTTDAAVWKDKWLIHVEGLGIYALDRESAVAGDDNLVVVPTVGAGRWVKKTNAALSAEAATREKTVTAAAIANNITAYTLAMRTGKELCKSRLNFASGRSGAACTLGFTMASGNEHWFEVKNEGTTAFALNFLTGSNITLNPSTTQSTSIGAGEVHEFHAHHNGSRIVINSAGGKQTDI